MRSNVNLQSVFRFADLHPTQNSTQLERIARPWNVGCIHDYISLSHKPEECSKYEFRYDLSMVSILSGLP